MAASSVFDWHILLDWKQYGDLGAGNFYLSWLAFTLFLVTGFWLAHGPFSWKPFSIAAGIIGCFIVVLSLHGSPGSPRVRNGLLLRGGGSGSLAVLGSDWPLAKAAPLLPRDCLLSLTSELPSSAGKEVWLFGLAGEQSWRHPHAEKLFFVAPPQSLDFPENTAVIYGFPGMDYYTDFPVERMPPGGRRE